MLENLIRLKSKDWQYEKEYRFVSESGGPIKYPVIAVKEIIFGLKMDLSNQETIRNLINTPEWTHVKTSKIKPVTESFSFDVLPII